MGLCGLAMAEDERISGMEEYLEGAVAVGGASLYHGRI